MVDILVTKRTSHENNVVLVYNNPMLEEGLEKAAFLMTFKLNCVMASPH